MAAVDPFPFSVVYPLPRDAGWREEFERNFGAVGDQWCEIGDTIYFRKKADAEALKVVLSLYSPTRPVP